MNFFFQYLITINYLLNILYNPRVKPGMTREEVASVLPEVLPEVREFVANNNPKSP
ncbi:MAG: DUF2927 domain-containing protein [Xanthobacteraceae bacterium]